MIRSLLPKNRWQLGAAMLAMVALICLFLHKKHSATNAPDTGTSALSITSAPAITTTWPRTIEASGPIVAWQEAIIGAEISGQRLMDVLVNVGDNVKRGQVLARFNTDMLQAQKAELEANWLQAEADRKRAIELKKSGAMSIQLIESYINKAAVAKARLDAKNLELHYASVTAPDDGVISSRSATLGAVSNMGTELFRMVLQNRFEWRGELTAAQLAHIAPGQLVTLTLPDGSHTQATIRQISPTFNPQSRLATVYADIAPDSHAHAGMYADGMIEIEKDTVVNVPAESIVIRDGYNYVFRLVNATSPTKVIQQRVTVGQHLGDRVEIVTGLHTGDIIAAKGAGFLNENDMVKIISLPGLKA